MRCFFATYCATDWVTFKSPDLYMSSFIISFHCIYLYLSFIHISTVQSPSIEHYLVFQDVFFNFSVENAHKNNIMGPQLLTHMIFANLIDNFSSHSFT